jgi:hypothetical protein
LGQLNGTEQKYREENIKREDTQTQRQHCDLIGLLRKLMEDKQVDRKQGDLISLLMRIRWINS